MFTQQKCYRPFHSPMDPCPPREIKCYSTPPQLYISFQPPGLQQFDPRVALRKGTLWPALYDPYPKKKPHREEGK